MNGRQNRTARLTGGEKLAKLAVSTALLALTACGGGGGEEGTEPALAYLEAAPVVAVAVTPGGVQNRVVETPTQTPVEFSIALDDASEATLDIVGQPANGVAIIRENGNLEYSANAGFQGTDTVEYVLTDSDGNQSTGTLFIAVVCEECVDPVLAENRNPENYPACENSDDDPDGDGFGYENGGTCFIIKIGAALEGLTAKADVVDLKAGDVQTVNPLSNDSIPDRSTVEFSIDVEPAVGDIVAAEANMFVYEAAEDYVGVDSMVYSIKDASGTSSMASIDFNITCDTCIEHNALKLSWAANPGDEDIDGYRVLFGSDDNPLTSTVVSEVQLANLNGESPSKIFDLASDLNITGAEGGCFMIKAYRGSEESEPSQATCFTRS